MINNSLKILNTFWSLGCDVFQGFQEHKSFGVLFVGNISWFLCNVILKIELNTIDYGYFALYVTFLNLIFNYGFLGIDHTVIRLSRFDRNKKTLFIPQLQIYYLCIPITLIIAGSIYQYCISTSVGILISCLLSGLLMLIISTIYNVLRLQEKFWSSQIVNNIWKIFFLLGIISSKFLDILDILTSIILMSLVLLIPIIQYSKVEKISFYKEPSTQKYLFQFFISLLVLCLITYSERIIIERKIGIDELGNYYFLIMLFLTPYNLIQNFLGFKYIILFKEKCNSKAIRQKAYYALIISILLSISGYIVFVLLKYFELFNGTNKNTITLIFLIGTIKVIYSVYSSAMGALASDKILKKSNLISLLTSLGLICLCLLFTNTLNEILIFIVLLWFSRLIIWKNGLSVKVP